MEREILHHDLSGVEETLGKNATLRKKLAEKEVLLDLTRMERDRAEKRLSESIWWNKRFYLEMVRKGAVPKPPSDDEGSERPRKTSKKSDGDEGLSDPCGPLIEAGGSGGAGGNADGTGVRGAGPTVPKLTGCTYATFIKCDPLPFNGTEGAVVKVEQYIRGLTKSIRGDVTSSQPTTINDAVRLAYQLARQLIQDKADKATEGEKRKGEGDRGGRGDNRLEHNHRQNQRR
nr:hypothetical protein [Tanacetum cinerariifolium]